METDLRNVPITVSHLEGICSALRAQTKRTGAQLLSQVPGHKLRPIAEAIDKRHMTRRSTNAQYFDVALDGYGCSPCMTRGVPTS